MSFKREMYVLLVTSLLAGSGLASAQYFYVKNNGSVLPRQRALNCVGGGIACTDDPTNKRTLITVAGGLGALCQDAVTSTGQQTTSAVSDTPDLLDYSPPLGTNGGGAILFSLTSFDVTNGSLGGYGLCFATFYVASGSAGFMDGSSRVFCLPVVFPTAPTTLTTPFGVPVVSGANVRTHGGGSTLHINAVGHATHTILWRAVGCAIHTF